jgi:peptidoglycan/xylan/chitin deacetylase (PgdA/CDA1 family)
VIARPRIFRARRRGTVEAVLGLLMLPLSALPIYLYLAKTPDGYLMYLRGRYALMAPATAQLDPAASAYARGAFAKLPVDGIPVLVYQSIGTAGSEDPSSRFIVSRSHFAQQMRALQDAGFQPVSIQDAARYIRTGETALLPRKPVLVTFDDGRTEAMLQADPILRDTGMQAAVFTIGKEASSSSLFYISWAGLAGYAASGRWELENHTYGLNRSIDDVKGLLPVSELVRIKPGETVAQYAGRVGADLDHDQALIASHNGGPALAFSYPFGDWGQHARTPAAVAALQKVLATRFQLAFDQDRQAGWRFALPGDNRLHIHRLQVQDWTGPQFIARLVAAAKLTQTAFRERGLDVHYDRRQLVSAAVSAACAPASPTPITSVATSTKAIALSFDDGPSPFTPQVLDVLRHYRAHATFFVLGQNLTDRSRVLGRMLVSGNEIANGTWTGAHAATIGANALESELRRTDAEIALAVPFRPCLTRPPYRENITRLSTLAGGLNLTTALWSVDPRDFTLRNPATIARRVLSQVRPGAIVILHDGGDSNRWATVQALPLILKALAARGYRVMSISQLLTLHSSATPVHAGGVRR